MSRAWHRRQLRESIRNFGRYFKILHIRSSYTANTSKPRSFPTRKRRRNLIIALGPSALKFVANAHEKFFRSVPVVFGGTEEAQADNPKLNAHFTGVWERWEPEKTLEAALRLQPKTKLVVVVGGVASYDRHLEAIYKEHLRSYASKLDIQYLTDLDMSTRLERLQRVSFRDSGSCGLNTRGGSSPPFRTSP